MTQSKRSQKLGELEALIESGLSCREVAAKLGVSAATAIRWTKHAGLKSRRDARLSTEMRAGIVETARSGVSASEIAARFGVCLETARRHSGESKPDRQRLREQLHAEVAAGVSRRAAAAKLGVSIATAIRWARADGYLTPPTRPARASRDNPPQNNEVREDKRARLMSAIASGLSRRKAAEVVGLPIATAIRWARDTGLG